MYKENPSSPTGSLIAMTESTRPVSQRTECLLLSSVLMAMAASYRESGQTSTISKVPTTRMISDSGAPRRG